LEANKEIETCEAQSLPLSLTVLRLATVIEAIKCLSR